MADEPQPGKTGLGPCILIMDDDAVLAEQWRAALAAAGCHVTVSHSATEAVAVVEQEHIDLVIIDLLVRTPDNPGAEGGLSLLRALRFSTERKLRTLKIIGVSGYKPLGKMGLAKQLMTEFGIEGFLSKPFESSDLVKLAAKTLAGPPRL
ncbi:MAG: response regulator [Pseudomonadota bacterium]